ncbi:hypothetical protein LCGC14_0651040 [marine sediment metagenome]|uniref:Uncharacterized protein n=1 Tax=marine sediment metagenome TaxID=412755 RepID=A0A0F9QW69_9ZZZZ
MKIKLTKKTAQKILKWSWSIVFLYALAAITLIIIDASNNPEIYNKGSDCKPLINLLDKFDKYVAPVWFAFIILVILSYLFNGWNYIKRNNNKKHGWKWKSLQFIRSSCWNLLFLYAVVGGFLIMYDAEKHPELYYVIEFGPQGVQGANPFISIIPEWHYRASTIQECKPMMNLLDKFDRYINPAWNAFIILAVVSVIIIYWNSIKKAARKFEEWQEEDD